MRTNNMDDMRSDNMGDMRINNISNMRTNNISNMCTNNMGDMRTNNMADTKAVASQSFTMSEGSVVSLLMYCPSDLYHHPSQEYSETQTPLHNF